ncbi:hypothetical protein [Pseudoalteromonas sp. Xi13]|uniref:hypothetical protein n=1 Tax=Pseudoalteromonas sp. Xi13 TaxID=2490635 RepID=UPI000F758F8F|nr:hypothetical protein [Pseudoalteromonas sp. Xi13]AZN31507.1 hypothetical protein EJ103_01710 [Pseudoalteromonas sp. Xi13]
MKNLFSKLLNLASALFMFQFALPKLLAAQVSVKTFSYFAQVLPVNAKIYMYSVGLLELVVGLMMLALLFIKNEKQKALFTYVAYVLLAGTLIGALLHEYFVRPDPVAQLVTYSGCFLVICAIQFLAYKKALIARFE